jgi:hypothetical protein
MAFNPKTSTSTVLYVTESSDDDAFIYAYPAGQTLVELSPKGDTCEAGTLNTTPPW